MNDLILMIFKTHSGEWLNAVQIRAIVSAITGKPTLLTTVRRAINKLTRQNKLQAAEDKWIIIE